MPPATPSCRSPDPYAHPRPPPAVALSVRRIRVAAGAQLRIPSQSRPPAGGTRPPHASWRRSTPATRAGRATPARRHTAASGEPYPVAQRQEPHRRLDRRQRVTLTDVAVAIVNLHRQLPERVIGHARRPLHPRRAKSGSPTEGQRLRSALLRATPPPPAPRAARSIAVHGRADQLQNSRRASPSRGSAGCAASSRAISTRSRTTIRRRAVRSRHSVVSSRTPVSVVPAPPRSRR